MATSIATASTIADSVASAAIQAQIAAIRERIAVVHAVAAQGLGEIDALADRRRHSDSGR